MSEKTPIRIMAELLADMTERAMEAERQRDAAKDDAGQWFLHYKNKAAELDEMKSKMAEKTRENDELRLAVQGYIEILEKESKEKRSKQHGAQ